MRLYIDDAYTFPEAEPGDLRRACDAFEYVVEHSAATVAGRIGDLDLALDTGQRRLTFIGYTDRGDDEWPRAYVSWAVDLMGKFASELMLEADLPRTVVNRRTEIRAQDDSFAAVAELTFTVPAA